MDKTQGAFTIVTDQQLRVLLVKRQDLPIWDLPGGKMENDEEPWETAQRELFEETGLRTEHLLVLGRYEFSQRADRQWLFIATDATGMLQVPNEEVRQAGYFSLQHLPINLVPEWRQQLRDFAAGAGDVRKTLTDPRWLCLLKKFL